MRPDLEQADRVGSAWVTETLERSLRSTILSGAAVGQLVILIAVFASPLSGAELALLVVAHVGLALVAVAIEVDRLPVWTLAWALPTVALLDLAIADTAESVLCFAAVWLVHGGQTVPSMLMDGRSRRWASLYIGVVLQAVVWVIHPDWLTTFVIPNAVAGVGIRAAGRMVSRWLKSFAQSVDDEEDLRWRERRGIAESQAASSSAAEQARTLHDTAINTLAAVASGGGAIRDERLVRQLCRRDVETLSSLVEGRATPIAMRAADVAASLGLTIDDRGLGADHLEGLAATIPPEVVEALGGAIGEALRNVAKHAGTDIARVDVREDGDELVVVVSDQGVGFDGVFEAGRGLAESVIARAAAAGISAAVEATPGAGTQISLRYPLSEPVADRSDLDHDAPDLEATVVGVRRRGCWLWSVVTVVVGVGIDTFGRMPHLSATYGMLATVAAVGLVSWLHVRNRDHLSIAMAGLVVTAVPTANLFAVAATDFGRGEILRWQAIGVVAPLVILLVFGRSRLPLLLGVLGLIVSSGVATVIGSSESAAAAAVVVVGTAPALGLLAAWSRFYKRFERVGRRGADAQRDAAEAVIERASRDASAAARERWRQTGLDRSLSLLRGIAAGDLDPRDHETQSACAQEEAYLRQVSMLDPEIYRLGNWLASSLALARSGGVNLVVRTGGRDVHDDDTATRLGSLLEEVVATAPAGSDATVGFFSSQGGLHFTLVGPAPVPSNAGNSWVAPPGWSMSVRSHEDIDVVEVVQSR